MPNHHHCTHPRITTRVLVVSIHQVRIWTNTRTCLQWQNYGSFLHRYEKSTHTIGRLACEAHINDIVIILCKSKLPFRDIVFREKYVASCVRHLMRNTNFMSQPRKRFTTGIFSQNKSCNHLDRNSSEISRDAVMSHHHLTLVNFLLHTSLCAWLHIERQRLHRQKQTKERCDTRCPMHCAGPIDTNS